jgi:hypothetical protein
MLFDAHLPIWSPRDRTFPDTGRWLAVPASVAARAAIESSVAALLRIVRSEIQTAIVPVSSFVEF